MKIRRISGRCQISADGKHLVDGLAFGRPLLRRPADRPSVNIPPRKRQRVTYNEDGEDDEGFLALGEKVEADGGDSDHENGNRQLVLHADFEDDDSEEDEDFLPGEDEELDEDSDEVDEDEAMENEAEEQEPQMESATKSNNGEVELDEAALDDVPDVATRTKIRKLYSAFPTSPLAVCKYVLNGSGGDVGEAYGTMSLGFPPAKPASAITESSKANLSVPRTRFKKSKAPAQEVEAPQNEPEATDSLQVEAAETAESILLEHYDRNGLPRGSISLGKALIHMAEAVHSSPGRSQPISRRLNSASSNKSVRFSLDEGLTNGFASTPAIDRESLPDDSEEESEDSSSDVTSSSGSSSSDEDSSSSDESKEDDQVSDTSSSGSDSDSSEDSSSDDDAPQETSSKTLKPSPVEAATVNSIASPKGVSHAPVPPGSGKRSTTARNLRRRGANALKRFIEKGILPAGTTVAEFKQLPQMDNNTSPEDASAALEAIRTNKKSAEINEETDQAIEQRKEFEVRRRALLESLASGGIEVGSESSKTVSKADVFQAGKVGGDVASSQAVSISGHHHKSGIEFSTAPQAHQPASTHNQALTQQISSQTQDPPTVSTGLENIKKPGSNAATPDVTPTKSRPSTPAVESAQSSAASPRRTKLDLGTGRRMLFSALGLRAPKSKEDEEKLRSDLMKDVRSIPSPKTVEKTAESFDDRNEEQDFEAWREKVSYRAVECCHEGIELTEPPFPFVQRWDPQQQGGWLQKGKSGGKSVGKSGGKRKQNQREEPHYYQDEGQPKKKQKQRNGKHSYAGQQEYLDASYEPSCQEDSIVESEAPTQETGLPVDDIAGEIDQQLMNDLKEDASVQVSQGPEDLAPLPEDINSLVDLRDGLAKPGMTIAFKQLTMSEETKWQPEISACRTAVVNAVLDCGVLQLTLALRDRVKSDKFYDVDTGERLYGKFDMPDQDEEVEEDDGIRDLAFNELVEPKIIQDAPADLSADKSQLDAPALPKLGSSTDSQTLSHEHEDTHEDAAADAQLSHVTETPMSSDAPDSNPGSPEANTELEDRDRNAQQSNSEVNVSEKAPKHVVDGNPVEVTVSSEILETSASTIDKDKAKQVIENNSVDETAGEQGNTPISKPDTSIGQISTDTRQRISQMMKDAGFRSSVPSSVIKDIRPTGMASPAMPKSSRSL